MNETIRKPRENHSQSSLSLSNEVHQLKKTNQELIDSLSAEVDLYKSAHHQIRNEINELATDGGQQTTSDHSNQLCLKHKEITDQALANLNEQLRQLQNERDTMRKLWRTSQNTCTNLERELADFKGVFGKADSGAQLRKEFAAASNSYKMTIADLKRQLTAQQQANEKLEEGKVQIGQRLSAIESKYKSFLNEQTESSQRSVVNQTALCQAKSHIAEVMRQRTVLEQRLAKSNAAVKEHMDRETKALEKIQEVLLLAESAIVERNAAQQREKEIKDECDHLATTIGQVMDEAATKCEQDMEQRDLRYKETICTLENHIAQLNRSLELQTTKSEQAESKLASNEAKINTLQQNIATLDSELEIASRTIIEMEIKIDELSKLLENEQAANRLNDERCTKLTEFLAQHRRLKESWKSTVEDISERYEEAAEENAALKSEIRQLKAKYLLYPPRDVQYGDGNNVIVLTSNDL